MQERLDRCHQAYDGVPVLTSPSRESTALKCRGIGKGMASAERTGIFSCHGTRSPECTLVFRQYLLPWRCASQIPLVVASESASTKSQHPTNPEESSSSRLEISHHRSKSPSFLQYAIQCLQRFLRALCHACLSSRSSCIGAGELNRNNKYKELRVRLGW